MVYIFYAGIGLASLGLLIMIGSAPGASDKRFKTGRKDNKQGDNSSMGIGFIFLIAGGALLFIWGYF